MFRLTLLLVCNLFVEVSFGNVVLVKRQTMLTVSDYGAKKFGALALVRRGGSTYGVQRIPRQAGVHGAANFDSFLGKHTEAIFGAKGNSARNKDQDKNVNSLSNFWLQTLQQNTKQNMAQNGRPNPSPNMKQNILWNNRQVMFPMFPLQNPRNLPALENYPLPKDDDYTEYHIKTVTTKKKLPTPPNKVNGQINGNPNSGKGQKLRPPQPFLNMQPPMKGPKGSNRIPPRENLYSMFIPVPYGIKNGSPSNDNKQIAHVVMQVPQVKPYAVNAMQHVNVNAQTSKQNNLNPQAHNRPAPTTVHHNSAGQQANSGLFHAGHVNVNQQASNLLLSNNLPYNLNQQAYPWIQPSLRPQDSSPLIPTSVNQVNGPLIPTSVSQQVSGPLIPPSVNQQINGPLIPTSDSQQVNVPPIPRAVNQQANPLVQTSVHQQANSPLIPTSAQEQINGPLIPPSVNQQINGPLIPNSVSQQVNLPPIPSSENQQANPLVQTSVHPKANSPLIPPSVQQQLNSILLPALNQQTSNALFTSAMQHNNLYQQVNSHLTPPSVHQQTNNLHLPGENQHTTNGIIITSAKQQNNLNEEENNQLIHNSVEQQANNVYVSDILHQANANQQANNVFIPNDDQQTNINQETNSMVPAFGPPLANYQTAIPFPKHIFPQLAISSFPIMIMLPVGEGNYQHPLPNDPNNPLVEKIKDNRSNSVDDSNQESNDEDECEYDSNGWRDGFKGFPDPSTEDAKSNSGQIQSKNAPIPLESPDKVGPQHPLSATYSIIVTGSDDDEPILRNPDLRYRIANFANSGIYSNDVTDNEKTTGYDGGTWLITTNEVQ